MNEMNKYLRAGAGTLVAIAGVYLHFFMNNPVSSQSIVFLLLGAAGFMAFLHLPQPKRRAMRLVRLYAAGFAVLMTVGHYTTALASIENPDKWNYLLSSVAGAALPGMVEEGILICAAYALAECVGLYLCFVCALCWLRRAMDGIMSLPLDGAKPCKWYSLAFGGKCGFWLRAALLFACWLPYLVALGPAGVSPDSKGAVNTVYGMHPWMDYNPVLWMLSLAPTLFLGRALLSEQLGLILTAFLQAAVFALCFSRALTLFDRYCPRRGMTGALWVFCGLYPPYAVYANYLWKNILFAGFVLVLCMELWDFANRSEALTWQRSLWLGALLFLTCFWQKNGLYVVLLTLPFILWILRRRWKQLLCAGGVLLLLTGIYRGPMFSALDVSPGPMHEAFSIPAQQIARVVRYHAEELDSALLEEIEHYMPSMGQTPDADYLPLLADPAKNRLSDAVLREDLGGFLRLWAKLLPRYLGEYVMAFLLLKYGYWYPGARAVFDHGGTQATEYYDTHPWFPALRTAVNSAHNLAMRIPIFGMIESCGLFVWSALLAAGLLLYRRKGKLVLPFVLLGFLFLTTIASPVNLEYRYIFGFYTAVPFLVPTAVFGTKKEEGTHG